MLRCVVMWRCTEDLTFGRDTAAGQARLLCVVHASNRAWRVGILSHGRATALVQRHGGAPGEIGYAPASRSCAVGRCGRTACPVSTRARRLRVSPPLIAWGCLGRSSDRDA